MLADVQPDGVRVSVSGDPAFLVPAIVFLALLVVLELVARFLTRREDD